MKNTKYIITASAILSTAITAFYLLNKLKQRRMSKIVADAGYETAADVHFPLLSGKYANNKLFIKS
jgi:hypothetical protein